MPKLLPLPKPLVLDVRVSKKDIKHGEIGNCQFCPIASAIYRAARKKIKGVFGVTVFQGRISIVEPHKDKKMRASGYARLMYANEEPPHVAQKFIRTFDNEDPVKPLRFSLTLTPPVPGNLNENYAVFNNRVCKLQQKKLERMAQ